MSAVLERPSSLAVSPEDDAPVPYSAAEFARLAAQYPDLRMELTAQGEVDIMAPAYSETGFKNGELYGQIYAWNKQAKLGYAFDSSSGFTMPSEAVLSPDVSWIERTRWDTLPAAHRKGFAHICPDFVIELRSESDRLGPLQKKMQAYITNGARLGWLIDPRLKRVEVYQPGTAPQALVNPQTLSGGDVLPGFVLDLTEIFTD